MTLMIHLPSNVSCDVLCIYFKVVYLSFGNSITAELGPIASRTGSCRCLSFVGGSESAGVFVDWCLHEVSSIKLTAVINPQNKALC